MVELKPAEYEAVVETIGAATLDEIAAECETTARFWQRLTDDLGERGVRDVLAAGARLTRPS